MEESFAEGQSQLLWAFVRSPAVQKKLDDGSHCDSVERMASDLGDSEHMTVYLLWRLTTHGIGAIEVKAFHRVRFVARVPGDQVSVNDIR